MSSLPCSTYDLTRQNGTKFQPQLAQLLRMQSHNLGIQTRNMLPASVSEVKETTALKNSMDSAVEELQIDH